MDVIDQLHAPAASLPEKRPRYPFYRRLGGSHIVGKKFNWNVYNWGT